MVLFLPLLVMNVLLTWVFVANGHAHVISNFKWLPLKPYLGTVSYPSWSLRTNATFPMDRHYLQSCRHNLPAYLYQVLSAYQNQIDNKKQTICTVPLGLCAVSLVLLRWYESLVCNFCDKLFCLMKLPPTNTTFIFESQWGGTEPRWTIHHT